MHPNERPNISDLAWQPLTIMLKDGAERKVGGPLQAINALNNEWPFREGSVYSDAKRKCQMALEHTVTCEQARIAFLEAAKDADMWQE